MRAAPYNVVLCACLSLAACADDAKPVGEPSESAPTLVLGADGVGQDTADTACTIVLRSISRVSNGGGGFMTTGPERRYVWSGELDVATSVAAGEPVVEVLFQTTEQGDSWFKAAATKQDASTTAGFVRYTFALDRYTPFDGMSGTALSRSVIRFIPYVSDSAGGRRFDHNRVSDVFASYQLDSQNQWTIVRDGSCSGVSDGIPRWRFSYPSFDETLVGGPIAASGQVRIAYDGRRLRDTQGCMGAHGSASATTLKVAWMFDGDATRGGSDDIERYVISNGQVRQDVLEPLIDVPADVADLAVWFYCVPGFDGAPNVKYDSNDGANYHAEVVDLSRDVDWVGGWAMYRGRPSDTIALAEPLVYSGFTNMGLMVQAEVYVAGLTDQAQVDATKVIAWVESDALACTPGGPLTKEAMPIAASHLGAFGNNVAFRWGIESLLSRCPKGTYRYRFIVSADGGLTTTTLGAAAEASSSAPDASWRTLSFQ